MFASTSVPAIRSDEWTNWHLLFASQPEPDLEFTDEDLDDALPPPAPPIKAPKRSGKRPLLWVLLLLLVCGIGYVAMDPDGAMQFIEPYIGTGTETGHSAVQPPSVPATKPTPAPTVAPPVAPVVTDNRAPASTDVPPPSSVPSSPMPAPTKAAPIVSAVKPAPPSVHIAGPRFAEGQRVTVIADPTRPRSPMPLFVDSVGTKTSTTVLTGATLTILDGDYQKNGWVYAVRTQEGRKGWIPERNLMLKR